MKNPTVFANFSVIAAKAAGCQEEVYRTLYYRVIEKDGLDLKPL